MGLGEGVSGRVGVAGRFCRVEVDQLRRLRRGRIAVREGADGVELRGGGCARWRVGVGAIRYGSVR